MSDETRTTIRCPECGAPLPPIAATAAVSCLQCGATSTPAQKPGAVQTVVVERVVVREGAAARDSAICPRCQLDLVQATADGIAMLGCGTCGGIWLDNEGARAVVQRHHPAVEEIAKRAGAAAMRVVVDRLGQTSLLHCPVCGRDMRRVVAADVADIDVCVAHGTWFDAKELQRVSRKLHQPAPRPLPPVDVERAEAELRAAAAEKPETTMPRDFGIARACSEIVGALWLATEPVARR
jgi:Zn-finger nucleic acid-binding protein